MKRFISALSLFALLFLFTEAKSQYIYQTYTGKLVAISELNGSLVSLHNKNVTVFLDYDKAQFKMDIPLSSMHSDIDSINSSFKDLKDVLIIINGKMSIEAIKTAPHLPLEFQITGKVNYKEYSTDFMGSGHLEHIEGSDHVACLLGLNFEIDAYAEFIPVDYRMILDKSVKVQLMQSVLERQKQSGY